MFTFYPSCPRIPDHHCAHTYVNFEGTHTHTHTHTHTYLHTGAPEIVIPLNDSLIEEVAVDVGRDAQLRCNFIIYPSAGTRWFRVTGQTETQLTVSTDSRYQFGENGTFVIRGMLVGDVGMYRCEVFNAFGADTRIQQLRVIGVCISV